MKARRARAAFAEHSTRRAAAGLCLVVAFVLPLAGCAPAPSTQTAVPAAATAAPQRNTASPAVNRTLPQPTAAAAVLPTSTHPPTPEPTPAPRVCSPLEGIAIAELGLPDLLKNPFQQPRPGMDDGHHGADFAYWSRGERSTMQGLPVLSALEGRVAGVVLDRVPYGNALIIETPLGRVNGDLAARLPTPQPTLAPLGPLNCPPDPTEYGAGGAQSLYLLYAHLNQAPLVEVGDAVQCGQIIGEVGTTGNSVNPHLHLEARVGPAGAVFESMGHYDTAASEMERAVYCTWRTSGLFAMLDPMSLFSNTALQP